MTGATETKVTVLRGRDGELFGAIDQHAQEMRRQRDALVKSAVDARDRAERAIELARHQENAAREAKAQADSELRRLLEKGELFIVGDSAIEVNEHGALHVRRARVVGVI
jgi:hypothetical protein